MRLVCLMRSKALGKRISSAGQERKTARERILDTAQALFYSQGIRAVGIDMIIEKSGVAKMSLYRNLRSKDDLVAAYLERASERYWAWWGQVMAWHPNDPKQQLHDLFEATVERVRHPEYRGCAFVNAATEFPEESSHPRSLALAHKEHLRAKLLKLCKAIRASEPKILANQLLMLIDGTYSTAGVLGRHDALKATAKAAEALVESALKGAGQC
jgi:AcrR family transcriptional regulator